MEAHRKRERVERTGYVWGLALCTCVWFVSCLFLRGDLGRWNDDYLFHHIDPVTDAPLAEWKIQTSPFFPPESGLPVWRPLFFTAGPALNTALWHHPAIMHAFQALLHLLVGGMLYALMRTLGMSRRAGIVAALVFLPCAPAFEVVFWTMAWPTVLATLLLVATMVLLAKGMQAKPGFDRSRPDFRWMAAAVLCALPVPLLNEQPAAAFLALPAIVLAARRPNESLVEAAKRGAWPIGVIGAWCVGYALLLVTSPSPSGGVGAAGQLIKLSHAGPITGRMFSWLWKELFEWHFIRSGARSVGIDEVLAHPGWAGACGAALLAAGIPAARWLMRSPPHPEGAVGPPPAKPQHVVRAGCVLLVAAAVVVGSLIPLIAVNAPLRPRMTYFSWIALCMVVGLSTDLARAWLAAKGMRLWPWSVTGLALLAWLVASLSISMIGAQVGYRDRWNMDHRIADQFRSAMPDPPPDTVFFLLWADDWPEQTRNSFFDHYYVGPLAPSWAYPTFLQHVYRRTDIDCVTTHWELPAIFAADESVVVPTQSLRFGTRADALPKLPDPPPGSAAPLLRPGQIAVAWDRVVLLETRPDGTVVLVEKIAIDRGDGSEMWLEPVRGRLWKGAERVPVRKVRLGGR